MKILIADDEKIFRRLARAALDGAGHEMVEAATGAEAWGLLQGDDPPPLAILDWMMPGLSGVEVCRRARARAARVQPYLILLTSREGTEDIVAGLEGGADDYITKPFVPEELRARIRVGVRVVDLQRSLADRVGELEGALARVKQLQGLLPICSYCKKVRDDKNYWQRVETYVAEHSEAQFSHGICPECYEKVVRPELERVRRARGGRDGP